MFFENVSQDNMHFTPRNKVLQHFCLYILAGLYLDLKQSN